MSTKTLITTCIELSNIKDKKNILYAGDWCLKNQKLIKNKNVVHNIWDSNQIIDSDYKKIEKIHKKINLKLSDHLYYLHEKKISKKIWKNLIYIWLTYYLFFYYFKWKTIIKISSINKKINFNLYESNDVHSNIDSLDFYNVSSNSDIFNYLAFKRVISYQKKNKLININLVKKNKKIYEKRKLSLNTTQNVKLNLSNKIILYFQKKLINHDLLIIDGINFKFKFFLNLFSFQFPINFKNIFNWEKAKKNLIKNKKKILISKIENDGTHFENFIFDNIMSDLPLCFTSGFSYLDELSKKIKFKPKIIVSGTQHVHNELAKLWMLKQKYEHNKKLFIVSHGGGHQRLSLTMFDYEHKIGDYFFEWLDKKKFYNYRLPNTKYSFNVKKRNKNADKIVFVGNELKPYINRISPGPMSISSSKIIDDLEIIFKNLNQNIRSKIFYAPKKKMIRYFSNKISKILKKDKILPIGKLALNIQKSKLVICSYPQTTFFDAIMSGPTILVYNPKLWRHYSKLNKSYKVLKSHGIVFDNSFEAAKHINHIWKDIDKWWNEKEVVNARNIFLKEFNLPPKNNLLDVFRCLKMFKNV